MNCFCLLLNYIYLSFLVIFTLNLFLKHEAAILDVEELKTSLYSIHISDQPVPLQQSDTHTHSKVSFLFTFSLSLRLSTDQITYSTLVFYHEQFVKCAENIITNYKTANAVTNANPGLM